jgi:F-type H+-transporting ATPase subunit delta
MSPLQVVDFYARRALELAASSSQLETWRADLRTVSLMTEEEVLQNCASCTNNFELQGAPCGPCFPQVAPGVADFACLLARHGKHGVLKEVAAEYAKLVDEYYGIRHAEIVTAVPLDEETEKRLIGRLREMTGRDFVLDKRVDPGVIGGVVLRIGDIVYDRSVRAKVLALRAAVLEDDERFGETGG